jgi:hypothetical protein
MTFVPALVVVCAQFLMHLVAWVGTALLVQVLGMLAMDATGLEVLVFALGGTLPVIVFVVAVTAIIAELALLTLAMLADNNGGRHRIDHTTCSSYAGWIEGISYAHIVPLACGVACALLPLESFWFDGASSFHYFHESHELIEKTP